MDIRKLSYVFAFVLAASFGAFACAEDEKDADQNGQECEAPLTACGDTCVNLDTNDDHCGKCDNACAEGETCQEGECVGGQEPECTEEDLSNCEPGQICVEGQCKDPEPAPECETDEDCEGEGLICVDGQCVEPEPEPEPEPTCEEDTDCEGEGLICDDEEKVCREGCREDEDCPEGLACNLETFTCEDSEES